MRLKRTAGGGGDNDAQHSSFPFLIPEPHKSRVCACLPGGRGPVVFAPISVDRFFLQGDPMADFESKWMAFYAEKVEPFYKEMVSHIEKLIIGTLIVSAGAHVSSDEPSIQLFGYLRHSLVGRGVTLIGVIILALNFIDGLYKLAKVNRHLAWQIVMSFFYIAVSVRLIQLILAFRGGD
jgi:hypothetical protein